VEMGSPVSRAAVGRLTVIVGTPSGAEAVDSHPGACPIGRRSAALKLVANNIAETESRATERVIWSAAARAELFWRFFMLFLGLPPTRESEPFYAGVRKSVKLFHKFILFLAPLFISQRRAGSPEERPPRREYAHYGRLRAHRRAFLNRR
jgi:hypothetical protein